MLFLSAAIATTPGISFRATAPLSASSIAFAGVAASDILGVNEAASMVMVACRRVNRVDFFMVIPRPVIFQSKPKCARHLRCRVQHRHLCRDARIVLGNCRPFSERLAVVGER